MVLAYLEPISDSLQEPIGGRVEHVFAGKRVGVRGVLRYRIISKQRLHLQLKVGKSG